MLPIRINYLDKTLSPKYDGTSEVNEVENFPENEKHTESAKRNCRKCYGRGYLDFSHPKKWEKRVLCSCVKLDSRSNTVEV